MAAKKKEVTTTCIRIPVQLLKDFTVVITKQNNNTGSKKTKSSVITDFIKAYVERHKEKLK